MKVEIDIRDDIEPEIALECVQYVIKQGKISRGENDKMYYCWATTFDTAEGRVVVCTKQYTKNDCFMVYKNNNV